jgi:hypothetical protein
MDTPGANVTSDATARIEPRIHTAPVTMSGSPPEHHDRQQRQRAHGRVTTEQHLRDVQLLSSIGIGLLRHADNAGRAEFPLVAMIRTTSP